MVFHSMVNVCSLGSCRSSASINLARTRFVSSSPAFPKAHEEPMACKSQKMLNACISMQRLVTRCAMRGSL